MARAESNNDSDSDDTTTDEPFVDPPATPRDRGQDDRPA